MSDFKRYCQHRVSEVPYKTLKSDCPKSREFTVKMDEIFSIRKANLAVIKLVQEQIRAILKLETVLLTDVRGGCIELTFRYFSSNRVFPMGETVIVALAEMKVKCWESPRAEDNASRYGSVLVNCGAILMRRC